MASKVFQGSQFRVNLSFCADLAKAACILQHIDEEFAQVFPRCGSAANTAQPFYVLVARCQWRSRWCNSPHFCLVRGLGTGCTPSSICTQILTRPLLTDSSPVA